MRRDLDVTLATVIFTLVASGAMFALATGNAAATAGYIAGAVVGFGVTVLLTLDEFPGFRRPTSSQGGGVRSPLFTAAGSRRPGRPALAPQVAGRSGSHPDVAVASPTVLRDHVDRLLGHAPGPGEGGGGRGRFDGGRIARSQPEGEGGWGPIRPPGT